MTKELKKLLLSAGCGEEKVAEKEILPIQLIPGERGLKFNGVESDAKKLRGGGGA